jgi:hypothetical protein
MKNKFLALLALAALSLAINVNLVAQNTGPNIQSEIPRLDASPQGVRDGFVGSIVVDKQTGLAWQKRSELGTSTGWTVLTPEFGEVPMAIYSSVAVTNDAAGATSTPLTGQWLDNGGAQSVRMQVRMPSDWNGDTNTLQIKFVASGAINQIVGSVGATNVVLTHGAALGLSEAVIPNASTGKTTTHTLTSVVPGSVHEFKFTPQVPAGTFGPGATLYVKLARTTDNVTNDLWMVTPPVLQYKRTGGMNAW